MSPLRMRAPSIRRPETRPAEAGAPLAAGAEPIDRAHLARYSLGSYPLEREVLGLFVAQLGLSLEQLRFAATDREWQIAAHAIKGSARAVGAWEVARLAVAAEKTPGVDDADARARILASLEDACETVQSYVEEAFPDEPARA